MRSRSPHIVRACIAAGLVLSAVPTIRGPWLTGQSAQAAPYAVRGLTADLLAQASGHPIPVVVLLRAGASPSSSSVLETLRAVGATNVGTLGLVNGITADVRGTALDALRGNRDILEVSADPAIRPYPVPHADLMNSQLARVGVRQVAQAPAGQTVVSEPDTLSIIHADQAQKQFNGRDVRVAIVDSGIDLGHPDLQNVLLKGPDGKPLYKDFTGTDLRDTVGHGTACAGTIAAQGRTVYTTTDTYPIRRYPPARPGQRFNDRTAFTFTGVAPGVKLMIAKVFDTRGGGTYSSYVRAIEWAVRNHADVISESWGYPSLFFSGSDLVTMADEAAAHAGVTVVVANGNDGPGLTSTNSPANVPDVIAVGASTDLRQYAETGFLAGYGAYRSDSIVSFSGRGITPSGRLRPDLVAPGAYAWTTYPHYGSQDGPTSPPYTIGVFGGTSQAAPVTAGVAAMVINAYEETHGGRRPTPAYVKQVLASSADDLGYSAIDQGAGRVNALRAISTVTHQGPSTLVSSAVNLEGGPGQRLSQTVAITNTGSTTERVSLDAQMLHQARTLQFGGTVAADNMSIFHFAVPAGITGLSASVNFDSQKNVPLPDGQAAKAVVLQIALYDPQNNLVNFEQSVLPDATFDNPGYAGSGFTDTTAGRPQPGLWTAVVVQAPERDRHQVRHYINLPFVGHIAMTTFVNRGGTLTPRSLTLRPGQVGRARFVADSQARPGEQVVSLHLRAQSASTPGVIAPAATVSTIPVVLTTDIPTGRGYGFFDGAFTGGVGTQGFSRETRYFTFNVPQQVPALQVSMAWHHRGNLFLMALIDPSGKVINTEDNTLRTPSGGIDLSLPVIDAYLQNPLPGRWRIAIYSLISAGLYPNEAFRGVVEFGTPRVQLDRQTITAAAGAGPANFSVRITNTGAGLQGYFSYATTDRYQYLALGGGGGTVQNGLPAGVGSTQVVTYTTNFVPPGTREVVTQAQVLNSRRPIEVELDDSQVASYRALGIPAVVTLAGQSGQGYVADVRGNALPIGNWGVQLSLPTADRTGPVYVASTSYAYALAPQPWVQLDAQLDPATLSFSSNLLVAQPSASVTFHGSVSVPADTAPGTYHAHIFIYTARGDQLADLPLAITVNGVAPAVLPTPDPLLATIASTQFFPEGATASGLTDVMDLVNPSGTETHAQIKLFSDNSWTTVMRYRLAPHSRLSVNMQSLVGKDQGIAAVVQGDQPIVGGRRISRVGESGSYSIGTVAPATRWYFADGYTVGTFAEYLEVVNTRSIAAHVHLHVVSDQGDVSDASFTVGPASRSGVKVNDLLSGKAVSATLTSDVPVVAERTQIFGSQGQGVTTAVGATAGSTSAYIDPGHLPAGTQAHLSLYNPQAATAHVQLTLLDSHGQTVKAITLRMAAGRRATVDLSAKYGSANLGARITSDVGIVAEKVGYFGNFQRSLVGGSDLPAVGSPATRLIFPGGTTANGAGDYLSLYNPASKPVAARITVLFGTGATTQRTVTLAASHRTTIKVGSLGIPPGPNSLIVEGVDGAQLYATQTIMNAAHTDGAELSGVPLAAQ